MPSAGHPDQQPSFEGHSRASISKTSSFRLLRVGSVKDKGRRMQKKIRKSASLPNTPLAEGFKFDGPERDNDRVPPIERKPSLVTVNNSGHFSINRAADGDKVTSVPTLPPMDPPPVLSKSRTQKFHKLFKTVPENEFPVDYFSCAFIGDILLQGNLYVSQNWFCFYSRIRGRGRLLEIPMESVISITREKTAIIFPNAIGLQTKTDKFAFGSFLTRDSTYKFLVSMWKKSQEAKSSGGTTDINGSMLGNEKSSSAKLGETSDNQLTNENPSPNFSNQSHSNNSKSDSSDQSDSSFYIENNSLDISDLNEVGQNDFSGKTDTNSNSSPVHKPAMRNKVKQQTHVNKERKLSHVRKKGLEGKRLQFPYSVIHCIDKDRTMEALQKSAAKLQKIPRTNLLLAICTVLVLFLLVSAIGLTYKILDLEAKISSRVTWSADDSQTLKYKSYKDMMGLQSAVRESTAQHVQNVLAANVRMLEEINSSLKVLHQDTRDRQSERPEVCQAGSC